MKAVMVMFDSLNRHMLPPYGCEATIAPNFSRLAQRALTFDRSYVCSMPCMPARRDLHTARPNFLHTSWGPLEPYDDSVPELLRDAGIHTHLTSDHYHYWEDGGANYHTRYSTWEFFRGQEGDPWIGQVREPIIPPSLNGKGRTQDWINRPFMGREDLMPQHQTFAAGLQFIERNKDEDNWFLQIETFDPHEPFFSPQQYKNLYPHDYSGLHFDWPGYRFVEESPEAIAHCRMEYFALLSMCDAQMGRVLDAFDRYELWDDTMLIVWTDHGFLLGEHNSWAKVWCPWYEELSHTPFFIYDPRASCAGERRSALVQPALDIGPTLLEYFGLERTPDMLGYSLQPVLENDTPVREAALFGHFGGHVNVTDGRYVYMRGRMESDVTLYRYALTPAHMRSRIAPEAMSNATLAPPFSFTKGCPVLRLPVGTQPKETMLFDLQTDPRQSTSMQDEAIERQMIAHLERLMTQCDAPQEQWVQLGLL
jgi:arylsulfatase A-like enzyme